MAHIVKYVISIIFEYNDFLSFSTLPFLSNLVWNISVVRETITKFRNHCTQQPGGRGVCQDLKMMQSSFIEI